MLGRLQERLASSCPLFVLVGVTPGALLRQSPWVSSALDGVNAASLGLMAAVTYTLGRAALVDLLTVVLALLSAIVVFASRSTQLG